MDQAHLFEIRGGSLIRICGLTEDLAREYADQLVLLHNDIPFQHWTVADLLATHDSTRQYRGKWEISRLALDQEGEAIGFCIGFELPPDNVTYHRPGIYMHRLSVHPKYRKQFVGALLQAEASVVCFDRGLRYIGPTAEDVVLYGQTNDVPENAHMLAFYRDAGFEPIGHKPYADRVDVVMQMTRQSFAESRHASLRRATLVVE